MEWENVTCGKMERIWELTAWVSVFRLSRLWLSDNSFRPSYWVAAPAASLQSQLISMSFSVIPAASPWRWWWHGPPKRWYPTTSLRGVIAQKISTWIFIQAQLISPWRWRQHGPPKRWYPTTSLHGVITQKTTTWISIQASLFSL